MSLLPFCDPGTVCRGTIMRVPAPKRVLVTGSGGAVGRRICPHLSAKSFQLRGFDRHPPGYLQDEQCGDLADLGALRRAARGMDTLIHLAACADEADFLSELMPANITGLYNTLEAARLEGVQRVILAGSSQAADRIGQGSPIGVDERYPTGFYGLTKLMLEDFGKLYANRCAMAVLVLRLGWVLRSRRELREMIAMPDGKAWFLSHGDLCRLFESALATPLRGYQVVYGFSIQSPAEQFDMGPSRRLLGYQPQDRFPEGLDFDVENLT